MLLWFWAPCGYTRRKTALHISVHYRNHIWSTYRPLCCVLGSFLGPGTNIARVTPSVATFALWRFNTRCLWIFQYCEASFVSQGTWITLQKNNKWKLKLWNQSTGNSLLQEEEAQIINLSSMKWKLSKKTPRLALFLQSQVLFFIFVINLLKLYNSSFHTQRYLINLLNFLSQIISKS